MTVFTNEVLNKVKLKLKLKFNLSFTFVFNLYEYFNRFSFSSVSGQIAVAVGFLTRDPSLIWNTLELSLQSGKT